MTAPAETFAARRQTLETKLSQAHVVLDEAQAALGVAALDSLDGDDKALPVAQRVVLSCEVEITALEAALIELGLREEKALAKAAADKHAADVRQAHKLVEKRAALAAQAIVAAGELGKAREAVRELDGELDAVERRLGIHPAGPDSGLWFTGLRAVVADKALGERVGQRPDELAQLAERATNPALLLQALDDRLAARDE